MLVNVLVVNKHDVRATSPNLEFGCGICKLVNKTVGIAALNTASMADIFFLNNLYF